MHFTREPIIETVISPKEGCKLLIRSSRGPQGMEEYYVDALEVVSFGRGFFFRSLERPKAFLLPVSDYEVLEVKEPRLALKTPLPERQNIKIGGGRAPVVRQQPIKEEIEEVVVTPAAEIASSMAQPPEETEGSSAPRSDRRRDRRRRRHRRSSEDFEWQQRNKGTENGSALESEKSAEGTSEEGAKVVAPVVLPNLIPPPSILISQTLSRYKPKDVVEESAPEKKPESSGSGEVAMERRSVEETLLSSTYFMPVESDRDFYAF